MFIKTKMVKTVKKKNKTICNLPLNENCYGQHFVVAPRFFFLLLLSID